MYKYLVFPNKSIIFKYIKQKQILEIMVVNYIIKEDGIQIVGSDFVKLNEKIKDDELHEYYIVEREDFIDNLIDWISEAEGSDKFLMKEDLKMLMRWEDDYILSSNSTNSYIGKNCKSFDETCRELLQLHESIS